MKVKVGRKTAISGLKVLKFGKKLISKKVY